MMRRGKVRAVGGHDLLLCYLDRWWLGLPKATLSKDSYNSVIIKHDGKLIVAPRRMSYGYIGVSVPLRLRSLTSGTP